MQKFWRTLNPEKCIMENHMQQFARQYIERICSKKAFCYIHRHKAAIRGGQVLAELRHSKSGLACIEIGGGFQIGKTGGLRFKSMVDFIAIRRGLCYPVWLY